MTGKEPVEEVDAEEGGLRLEIIVSMYLFYAART